MTFNKSKKVSSDARIRTVSTRYRGGKKINSDLEPKLLYAIIEDESPTEVYQCPACGSKYVSNHPSETCPFCGSSLPPIIKGFVTEA